jgi:ketosteroid isomerase-like protein/DNA-binding XRE family transcriptional regulator
MMMKSADGMTNLFNRNRMMGKEGLRINGKRFAELRKHSGFTQVDLAHRAGYSERVVRKAESGGPLRFETIRDLSQCLSTPDQVVEPRHLLQSNRELAIQFVHAYDHFSRDALSHCEGLFTEDFEFFCPGDPDQAAFAGHWKGVDGMQEFFDRFFSIFSRKEGSLQPTYLEADNRVVARYEDQVFFESHTMPSFWVNLHFQFRDGLIARIDDEYDTRLAAESFSELLRRLGRI